MNINNEQNFDNDEEKNIILPIRKASKNEEVKLNNYSMLIFLLLIQMEIKIL